MVRNPKCAESVARALATAGRAAILAAGLAMVLPTAASVPAAAAQLDATSQALTLEADKAQIVQLPEPASTVFVANPDVADIQVPGNGNATSFLAMGKKAGAQKA